MWGCGNSAGLVQLSNYEQAKNRYENTRSIRGRSKETKPLGRNRAYTDRIIKKNWRAVDDGGVGTWQVTYSADVWGRDRLEWFPDGKIFVGTGGYSNPTINATIGYSIGDAFGEMHSQNGKQYFKTKDGKGYLMTKEGLLLEPTGEEMSAYGGIIAKVMRPINPQQEYRYSTNRKAMNALRKKYKEFIQYGVSMFLIDNKVDIGGEELKKFFGSEIGAHSFGYAHWNKEACEKNRKKLIAEIDKFNASGDLELAYLLARYIGRSGGGWQNRCTPTEFKRHFDEILKFEFRDEVFTATPQPIGHMFYDANAKFFK